MNYKKTPPRADAIVFRLTDDFLTVSAMGHVVCDMLLGGTTDPSSQVRPQAREKDLMIKQGQYCHVVHAHVVHAMCKPCGNPVHACKCTLLTSLIACSLLILRLLLCWWQDSQQARPALVRAAMCTHSGGVGHHPYHGRMGAEGTDAYAAQHGHLRRAARSNRAFSRSSRSSACARACLTFAFATSAFALAMSAFALARCSLASASAAVLQG